MWFGFGERQDSQTVENTEGQRQATHLLRQMLHLKPRRLPVISCYIKQHWLG